MTMKLLPLTLLALLACGDAFIPRPDPPDASRAFVPYAPDHPPRLPAVEPVDAATSSE